MTANNLRYIWPEIFPKKKEAWNEYYKFSIVRNPWARRLSQWQFIKTKAKKGRTKKKNLTKQIENKN